MIMNEKIKWRALGRTLMLLMANCIFTACPNDPDPAPPTLELNPTSINFTKNNNDRHELTITTSSDATWRIYDSECSDWLSVSTKEGKGSMTITLTTKNENDGGEINVEMEINAGNEAGSVSEKVKIHRDGIPNYDENYVKVAEKLFMSYGMACAIEWGSATSYFLYNIYTANDFTNLRGNHNKIVEEAPKSGSGWTRCNIPSSGGVEILYDKCQPNTNYVFVAVAYLANGTAGQITIEDFSTKDASEDNQARVSVAPLKRTIEEVHDSNNGPWYKWDTSTDGRSDFYITYACASDRLVETMQAHNNVFGVIDHTIGLGVAWNILMESKNSDLESTRMVTFNKDNSSGREKLMKQRANGTQWLEYRSTDKYLQIVTWAFKGNDFSNPSGVVSDVLYHVDNGVLREVPNPDPENSKLDVGRDDFGTDTNLDDGATSDLTIDKSEIKASAQGGTFSVSLRGNDSWTATSSASSWCQISPTKGAAPSTLSVQIGKNETISSRNARITITGTNSQKTYTINVIQDGASEVGRDDFEGSDTDLDDKEYSFAASPSNIKFETDGGSTAIAISGNDNWTATSNVAWCTLSAVSGSAPATLMVTAAKNYSGQRTGRVSLSGTKSGKTITIDILQERNSSNVGRDDFGSDTTID